MDFNLEERISDVHPAIKWQNYFQQGSAPQYTNHYTHYNIFNPENVVVPPVPVFYGDTLEPLVAAWQTGTLDYDA